MALSMTFVIGCDGNDGRLVTAQIVIDSSLGKQEVRMSSESVSNCHRTLQFNRPFQSCRLAADLKQSSSSSRLLVTYKLRPLT